MTTTRVGIVGSGLAGLVCAYLLAIQRDATGQGLFEVILIEKADSIGLESTTLVLPNGRRIETPMRAAQGGFYAHLLRLYRHLGIECRTVDFDYCISQGSTPLFQYEGANGLRWNPISRPAERQNREWFTSVFIIALSYIYVGAWAAYYWLRGRYSDIDDELHHLTLREWCTDRHVPSLFCDTILYPLFAAVCTAPTATVEQTPAADVLEYMIKTFGARHYLSDMRDVVSALLRPIPKSNVRLGFEVAQLEPCGSGLLLHNNGNQDSIEVDHVILCAPSSVAARISRSLAKILEATGIAASQAVEAEYARADLIGRFPTRQTTVVNHRDARGADLPERAEDRRILNLSLPERPTEQVSATHIIDRDLFQTTSPRSHIDTSHILSEITLERAVCTVDSRQALKDLWEGDTQGLHHLWFAGAWAAKGIPLLEGCVSGAERVAQKLCERQGVICTVPW